jgi:hypothetical protein
MHFTSEQFKAPKLNVSIKYNRPLYSFLVHP